MSIKIPDMGNRFFEIGVHPISKLFRLPCDEPHTVFCRDFTVSPNKIKEVLGINGIVNIVDTLPNTFNTDYWYIDRDKTISTLDENFSVSRQLKILTSYDLEDAVRYLYYLVRFPWEEIDRSSMEVVFALNSRVGDAQIYSYKYDIPSLEFLIESSIKKINKLI